MECALALQNFHTDGVFSAFSHYLSVCFPIKNAFMGLFFIDAFIHLFSY